MPRSVIAVLLILSFGCFSIERPTVALAAPPLVLEQSLQDRRDSLERIWKAVEENYYDPDFNGVDWKAVHERYRPMLDSLKSDEEFYKLMERMVGELHDAHTHVLSPERAQEFKRHQRMSLGFGPEIIDDQLVVARVTAGSQAERAGLEPGMIVRTLDGRPLADRVREVIALYPESSTPRATRLLGYARAFMGEPGTTVKLGLERADGSSLEVTLTREVAPQGPDLVAKLMPSGEAYISFNVFYAPAAKEFKEALRKFHEAPGLIIDLRRNPGGSSAELTGIASNFFAAKTVFARSKTRTHDTRPFYVDGKESQKYSGPVVILTGPNSGSSSELFAAGMQDTGRAKIVGAQTCGCVLGITHLAALSDGGSVTISQVLWFTPHDRKLEGEGVIPDRTVTVTLTDLRQKRDPVLEEGERLLKEMAFTAAPGK
jgi:carboxyl-terminal processing protease